LPNRSDDRSADPAQDLGDEPAGIARPEKECPVKSFKKHLSVANVLSVAALFVALGGSAYAAAKLGTGQVKAVNIAREAVTQQKLRANAVTSGKIANGQVNNRDLANGSVSGNKLGKEAVKTNKLAKKAVTATALGPEAVTNAKLGNEAVSQAKLAASLFGQLVKNVSYITETSKLDSEDEKSVTAFCPTGKEVLGGGVRISGEGSDKVVPTESSPNASLHLGWTASAREIEAKTAGNWSVSAFAVCAQL
jgi:hypothetical protein